MTYLDVLEIMHKVGYHIKRSVIHDVVDYVDNMLRDSRILVINRDGEPYALVLFSISNSYEPYFLKNDFDFLPHNPNGRIIYLEKLISKGWDKELRQQFEETILQIYPQLETAVWHRRGDRKIVAKRRLQYV